MNRSKHEREWELTEVARRWKVRMITMHFVQVQNCLKTNLNNKKLKTQLIHQVLYSQIYTKGKKDYINDKSSL